MLRRFSDEHEEPQMTMEREREHWPKWTSILPGSSEAAWLACRGVPTGPTPGRPHSLWKAGLFLAPNICIFWTTSEVWS